MNQREALKDTIQLAEERGMPEEHQFPSLSLNHIRDMASRITPEFSDAKIGRWLGWAQCAVVAAGLATLDEMKAINQKHSHDMPACVECGAEVVIDVTKIHSLKVFCPNSDCMLFAQSFWIDR